MIDNIKNNFLLYLVFLTPFSFILGIAIVEIIVLFLIIFFIIKNRNLIYYKDQKFLFLILFSIYVGINAFFQINDNLKFSSIFFFRFCLLSLSIFFLLDLKENIPNNDKKILLLIIVIISIFIIFDSYIQFFTGKNTFGLEMNFSRVSSIFGSELILGSFLLKLLPIIFFLSYYSKIQTKKYYLVSTLFFSFYFSVIYIAAGRTPFFLMLLFIILAIFFIKDLRKILYSSLLILIIFIFSTFLFEFGKFNPGYRIFLQTFNQIAKHMELQKKPKITNEKKKDSNDEIKIFSNDHQGHYILAYELFKKNPIWGIGPKGFRHYCRSVKYDPPIGICSTHPHNFLIQIISETGLVGLIFYLSSLIFVILKLMKIYNSKNIIYDKNCFVIISIGLIVNFFPFVPNGNFFNNWISIINFYYIGLYLFSYKKIFNS